MFSYRLKRLRRFLFIRIVFDGFLYIPAAMSHCSLLWVKISSLSNATLFLPSFHLYFPVDILASVWSDRGSSLAKNDLFVSRVAPRRIRLHRCVHLRPFSTPTIVSISTWKCIVSQMLLVKLEKGTITKDAHDICEKLNTTFIDP